MSTPQLPQQLEELRARVLSIQRGFFKIYGSVCIAVGLGALVGGGWMANRQYAIARSWPVVDAQVTRSELARYPGSQGNYKYKAVVEFRNVVNGKAYVSPASSSYGSSSYAEMKRQVDSNAPGTLRSIRYNPADPNAIRFDVGFSVGFFILPLIFCGIGLVFGAVGFAFLKSPRLAQVPQCPSCGGPVEKGQKFCPDCAAALSSA